MSKNISDIARLFDEGKIRPDETWDIETRDLVRLYKNLQRALSDRNSLEAKVASLEMHIECRSRGKAIYG